VVKACGCLTTASGRRCAPPLMLSVRQHGHPIMVVLRATNKLARVLPASADSSAESDTALGDWYVNRLTVDRQPLLLLVSARSLLAIITPARDVRGLPERLAPLIATRLKRLGIAAPLIAAEIAAMEPVAVAKTADRSVVGIMVDYAKMIPSYLAVGSWDATTLPFVEAKLARNPCHAGGPAEAVILPDQATPSLLSARWHAAEPAPGPAER
jgi:Domain of unknown function (DUF6933)